MTTSIARTDWELAGPDTLPKKGDLIRLTRDRDIAPEFEHRFVDAPKNLHSVDVELLADLGLDVYVRPVRSPGEQVPETPTLGTVTHLDGTTLTSIFHRKGNWIEHKGWSGTRLRAVKVTEVTDWQPIAVTPEGHTAVPSALIEELQECQTLPAHANPREMREIVAAILAAVDGGEQV